MQRRLLRSFVGIAIVVLVGLGLPLGLVATRLVREEAAQRIGREADAVTAILGAVEEGSEVPVGVLDPFLAPTTKVTVVDGSGVVRFRHGPSDVGREPIVVVDTTPNGLVVRVETDGGPTRARTVRVWSVIGLVAAGALALTSAVAVVQSRRLARPLGELAAISERLGAGEFPAELPSGGVPEIDEVAQRLRTSAASLERALAREREFSANASHQLRTVLTALRLRLEELDQIHDPEEFRLALGLTLHQADRLEATVEELLAFARDRLSAHAPVRLGAVVGELAATWAPVLERAGRRLETSVDDTVVALGSEGAVRQAVDVLLDNAVRHGGGVVRVTVDRSGSTPVVRVTDEGPGIPAGAERLIFERGVTGSTGAGTGSGNGSGSGIGLALARELIETNGGRLVLVRPRPPIFELYLATPGTAPDPPARPDR